MVIKPIRGQGNGVPKDEDLVSFAHRMAMYFEEIRHEALSDIRRIDSANNKRRSANSCTFKSLPTRETERERISIHEKAVNNPILRDILRKMDLKW